MVFAGRERIGQTERCVFYWRAPESERRFKVESRGQVAGLRFHGANDGLHRSQPHELIVPCDVPRPARGATRAHRRGAVLVWCHHWRAGATRDWITAEHSRCFQLLGPDDTGQSASASPTPAAAYTPANQLQAKDSSVSAGVPNVTDATVTIGIEETS